MKYPIVASITVVQISPNHSAHAWVTVETERGKTQSIKTELDLGNLPDATDPVMWSQMVAASVCDAL
jgi:hypothetical protein